MTAKRSRGPQRVKVVQLPHGRGLPLPDYQSEGAAGFDLLAAVRDSASLKRGARALVPTGLILELPRGYEAQVRPRSGLALRHGVTVLNSPGTVDSDYRGEIMVLLVNLGDAAFAIRRGDRIAQMVVQRVEQVRLSERKAASTTARGAGGFGSTGKRSLPARKPAQKKGRQTRRP